MRLSTATTAALTLFALSSSVAADRHAHPPPEAMVKGGLPDSSLVARHLHHAHQKHHNKRGSCPKRLHKSQKSVGAGYGTGGNGADSNGDEGSNSISSATNKKAAMKSTYVDSATSSSQSPSPTDDWNPKTSAFSSPSSSSSHVESYTSSTSHKEAAATPSPSPKKDSNDGNGAGNSGGALSGAGLLGYKDQNCGASGATDKITKTSGPNGSMDWLNCGLDAGGWNPPDLHIDQVSAMPLDEALEDGSSPFQPCKPYKEMFDKYGNELGIPPILLASIAMQESSCNKNAMGDNGGAYGLMQITHDKCASGVNCSDPDYNIRTGAKYFKERLDANGGNLLLALGQYNGWYKGLTVAKATAIKGTCCQCQNNINYQMQMLNGWFQNIDGSTLGDWSMGC